MCNSINNINIKETFEPLIDKTNDKTFINNDKTDNSYYQTLYEINYLFQNINYKSKIGSKTDPNAINQTIIYYNPINITEEFILNIHNINSITVTIPLAKSNYNFTSKHTSIKNVYNYLTMHTI